LILPHLLLTDDSVGKTSLMNRYSTGTFTGQYKATIGADCLSKEVICTDAYGQRHLVVLQIWDTAGQERFQSLGVAFYRGADACMLAYDVTDVTSLEHLLHWKIEFLQQQQQQQAVAINTYSAASSSTGGVPFPFVVVANKTDKIKERKIPLHRGQEWCQQHASNDEHLSAIAGPSHSGSMTAPLPHFETSAKTAVNVEDAFLELARLALHYEDYKRRSNPQLFIPPMAPTIDLRRQDSNNNEQSNGMNQCC
jgi:Ras-related protein Rab-7A